MDHSKTLLLAAALTAGTAALAAGAECGGMCAAAKAPRFDLRWEHRFVFEAERDLPDGYAFLPAAHYSATVEKLPAEMRFAREDETVARFAAPTNVAPPYVMHLMANGAQKPSVFVTKDGDTSLAYIAGWPKGFEPRTASLTNALRLAVSDGMRDPKASLSAGIGQADTRFVTWGRTNRPYVEDGRLFFTFSARAYGAYLGVMSFNPDACDFRLEGIVLFDYGDGLLRNDLAADLFYDDEAKEWRAYVSNFSTGTDSLDGRAKGGVNVAWSKACPLRGVSVMRAKSLGLDGMNEDPDGYWDAGAGKWRLLVSEFTAKGIRASLLESDNWDGPFRRIAGPVAEDSTGTTLAVVDGRLRALAGSADRALYIYDYPTLERVGQMNVPRPTWEISSSANGRSWPAYAELPDGRRLLLTFDRVNFAGMPEPNWTYGGLYLYGNGLARGCRSAYSVAILGDTHYDAEPESAYHSHYDESNRWAKVQHAEFRRNGEMWRGRCRDLVAASARLAREKPTDFGRGTADAAPANVVIKSDARTVRVTCGGTKAVFSRTSGTLCELVMGGKTILKDPADGVPAGPLLTCARAFVDNDRWVRDGNPWREDRKAGGFFSRGLSQLRHHVRPIAVDGSSVRIVTEVTGMKSAGFTQESTWTFGGDGSVRVTSRVTPHGTMPPALPRLGHSLKLDRTLENIRYYGRGPRENYVDRLSGSFLGVWTSTVTDQYEPYARPQDNGYKCDVRWVELTDAEGRGVRFSASEPLFVQALHYGMEDLEFARHRDKQKRFRSPPVAREEVCLNLDVRQLGLGGASCGPKPLEKYVFPIEETEWTLTMQPVGKGE